MIDLNIDKGFRIPEGSAAGAPTKYPFKQMEVGDSVFVDGQKTGGKAYLAAMATGRSQGLKFSGRNVENGIRIWRIA